MTSFNTGFIQITIDLDSKSAELLSDIFMDLGALSASIEDPYEGTELEQSIFTEPEMPAPSLWEQSKLVILFDTTINLAEVLINAKTLSAIDFAYTQTIINDQDWVRLTQSQFNPIKVTKNLYIVPSWHNLPDKNAIGITLDPGLAFGTGSHPTTFMCLQWISEHISSSTNALLDYGCGSGILAIAAKKCGARLVIGVDIDPQAIESSIANAANNQLTIPFGLPHELLQINNLKNKDKQAQSDGDGTTFEIVVANILSNPLRLLAPNLAALTQDRLILSGILESQAAELSQIYSKWFNMSIAATMDGWVLLHGYKLKN